MTAAVDNWGAGDAYETYMGRWSRPLARAFVDWLGPRRGADWLEVGCGTGALTQAICQMASPGSVLACDPSEPFIEHAAEAVSEDRASFVVASAEDPPGSPRAFDYVVSGLALNFIPEPGAAIGRMIERLRPRGVLGAYVWDYAGGMEFLRCFWDEAAALDPAAAPLDEGRRFPICDPDALDVLFVQAGLQDVRVEVLEVPTRFASFDDFWMPFLRGTGPAPSYVAALSPERRTALRRRLQGRLRPSADDSIRLVARAWAARGAVG